MTDTTDIAELLRAEQTELADRIATQVDEARERLIGCLTLLDEGIDELREEGGDRGAMLADRIEQAHAKIVVAIRAIAEDDDDPLGDF